MALLLQMASLAAEVLLHDSAGGLLAETSPDLHHRCQQSVDDLLARDLRGEAPQLYADLLDGVSVAPLNGTDDVQRTRPSLWRRTTGYRTSAGANCLPRRRRREAVRA